MGGPESSLPLLFPEPFVKMGYQGPRCWRSGTFLSLSGIIGSSKTFEPVACPERLSSSKGLREAGRAPCFESCLAWRGRLRRGSSTRAALSRSGSGETRGGFGGASRGSSREAPPVGTPAFPLRSNVGKLWRLGGLSGVERSFWALWRESGFLPKLFAEGLMRRAEGNFSVCSFSEAWRGNPLSSFLTNPIKVWTPSRSSWWRGC